MPKAVVQTTLRLDPAIYAAAQEAAKAAGVSLNEWFAAQIRAALRTIISAERRPFQEVANQRSRPDEEGA